MSVSNFHLSFEHETPLFCFVLFYFGLVWFGLVWFGIGIGIGID